MSGTLKPATEAQLRDAVRWAAAEEVALEIRGGGSRAIGRPVQAGHVLDASAFTGIVGYEPEELVMTAAAATPMAEIDAALREKCQMLAFEPVDTAAMLGAPAGSGTIAGALGVALSGPRRVKAGAARDHLLGFQAVSGRGESYKAGGKVVKNVTGYDLPKLLCGAHGTLSVLTEVTLKVLPAPPKVRTVLLLGLDERNATRAMADALNAPFEVSAAAHLPAPVAARSSVDFVRDAGASVTALRIEGTPGSVAARTAGLRMLLAGRAPDEELHSMRSTALWREIRDVASLLPDPQACLWRLSLAPAAAAAAVAGLGGARFFDWGGGLVWLATPATGDGGEATIRLAIAQAGGHATLIRGPEAVRATIPVFQPQPPALAAITRRVKEGFDPKRVLNPGRMYADI